jgi:hypothetical protein
MNPYPGPSGVAPTGHVPRTIPTDVFRHRKARGFTATEAVVYWLVEDPEGPGITHAEAAEALGMETRNEVGVILARMRERGKI